MLHTSLASLRPDRELEMDRVWLRSVHGPARCCPCLRDRHATATVTGRACRARTTPYHTVRALAAAVRRAHAWGITWMNTAAAAHAQMPSAPLHRLVHAGDAAALTAALQLPDAAALRASVPSRLPPAPQQIAVTGDMARGSKRLTSLEARLRGSCVE